MYLDIRGGGHVIRGWLMLTYFFTSTSSDLAQGKIYQPGNRMSSTIKTVTKSLVAKFRSLQLETLSLFLV